jgi:hypothetical protein
MSSTEATTEPSKYNTEAHSSFLFAKRTSKSADVTAIPDMIDNYKVQGKKVIEIKLGVGENEAKSQNLTNTVPNNKNLENQDDIVFLITDITDNTLDIQTNDLVTMSAGDFDNLSTDHFSTGKIDDSATEKADDSNMERKKDTGAMNLQLNRSFQKFPSHQFAGIDSFRRFVTSSPSAGASLRTRARTDDTDAARADFQAASSTEVQTQTIASDLASSARYQKKVGDTEEASDSTTIQTSIPYAEQTQANALDRQTSDETSISWPKASNQVSGNNGNWVPASSKDQILGNGTDQTPASVNEQTAINAALLTTSAANQIAATSLGKTAENVVRKSPASSSNMKQTSPHRIQKPSSSGDKIQTSSSSSSSASDFVQQTTGTMDETELVGADYQAASISDDPLAGSTGTLRPEAKDNITPSMHRKSSRSWFEESKFKSRTNSLKVSNDMGSLNSLGKDMMNKHGMPIYNKSGIVSGNENQSTVNVEKSTASVGNLSTVTVGNQSTAIVGNQSLTHVGHESAANVGKQGRTDDKIQGNTSMGYQTKAKAGNQSTKGLGNQSTKGFGYQSAKGFGNQSTKGFGNQSTTVLGNQSTANAGNQSSSNLTKQGIANVRTQDTANLGNKTKANVGNQGTINKSMPNAGKKSTVNVKTDNMTQGNVTSVMKDTGNESRKNFSADPQE